MDQDDVDLESSFVSEVCKCKNHDPESLREAHVKLRIIKIADDTEVSWCISVSAVRTVASELFQMAIEAEEANGDST